MDGKTSKKKPGKTDRTGHHRLGFWVSVVTAVLVVFVMIILTLLPLAMKWGAERMLLSFGAKTATISDIDFNPITGSLSVHDLQVAGLDADRASMERLTVKVDLFPVFRKRIRFRKISLTGLSLDIRQFEDGSVTIGGLSIPEKGEAEQLETEVESDASPWGLGLGTLDVKRLTVHLITPSIDETVVLKHLSLKNIETWAPDKSGDYALKADFLGGTVAMEGTTRPFIESMQVSTRIKLEELRKKFGG